MPDHTTRSPRPYDVIWLDADRNATEPEADAWANVPSPVSRRRDFTARRAVYGERAA